MEAVQIWVLTGLVGAFFIVLVKIFSAGLKRLDTLIQEVHELNITVSSHKGDIERNADKTNSQDGRLNKHSDRIRKLEINQAKCKG